MDPYANAVSAQIEAPVVTLAEMIKGLSMRIGHLHGLNQGMARLQDAILGPRPEAVGSASKEPQSAGIRDAFSRQLNDLDREISQMDSRLTEITRAVIS